MEWQREAMKQNWLLWQCVLLHISIPFALSGLPGPLTVSYRDVGASKKRGNPRSQAELTTLLLSLHPLPCC